MSLCLGANRSASGAACLAALFWAAASCWVRRLPRLRPGRVVAFDRETGETLWNTEVGEHNENSQLDEVPQGEPVEVLPGVLGGVETPMALADRVVYAAVVNMATEYTATGHDAEDGTEAVENAGANTDFEGATGEVVAIDVNTGDIQWTTDLPDAAFGGATVVNDLVITSIYDGTVYALDRETGEEVWTYQAETGINAWPAVADDTILIAAGVGSPAQLIALRLGD